MELSSKLSGVVRVIKRERSRQHAFSEEKNSPLQILPGLLTHQRTFLIWTALLSVFELLEVWILLERYHTFLVGGTLGILRLVSITRLLPLGALLGIRALLGRRTPHRREGILAIAQGFLVFNTILALGLVSWLTFGTDFYVSASPFVRAIVLASIASLPLEGFTLVLLFNLSSLTNKALPRGTRIATYAAIAFALVLLWSGFASGFFVLRLLGSCILPVALVSILGLDILHPKLSFSRLTSSVKRRFTAKSKKQQIVTNRSAESVHSVITFSLKMALIYFAWEMIFLSWSSRFVDDQSLALFFFVIHKVSHFSSILSFRFLLRCLSKLGHATAARLRNEVSRLLDLVELSSVWCILIGLVVVAPFAILKERLLLGNFPLAGPDSTISVGVIVASLVFMVSFAFGSIHLFLLSLSSLRGYRGYLVAAGFLVYGYLASSIAHHASFYEHPEGAVEALFLCGAALNVAICIVSRRWFGAGHASWSNRSVLPSTFKSLGAFIDTDNKSGVILILKLRARLSEEMIAARLTLESPEEFTVMLGRYVLVRLPTSDESGIELSSLVARVAALPEVFLVLRVTTGLSTAILSELLVEGFPPHSRIQLDNPMQLSDKPLSAASYLALREQAGVIEAKRSCAGWSVPQGLRTDVRIAFIRFLEAIERYKDTIHAACLRGPVGKCFYVNLTEDTVLWIPPELRSTAAALQGHRLREELKCS